MTTTREILDWLVEVELDRTPRSDEVLTEEDLAAWLPGCPDAAQAEAREAVVAMGLIGPTATGSVWSDTPFAQGAGSPTDDPNEAIREVPLESWRWQAMGDPPREARKAAVAELREHVGAGIDFDAVLAIFESHGEIVKRPRLVFMAPLRIDASGVFEPGAAGGVWELAEVHRRWLDIREADRPRHPLAPLVAAWLNRPRPVERRHVTVPAYVGDRALVRSPALLDLASFGSLNEIEVIEVDAEPIVSRTATIDGLKHRRPRKQAYRREPMQGELIPGPRTLSGEHIGDVVLRALSLYALAGDERNPIRGDIYRLALATFAISGAMTIQPAAGALFIGGRDTPANRARWWAASESLHGLTIRVNERTGEWRNLAVVDVEKSGTVHMAPPAWWRGNNRWRLAGGLFRPVLLGEEDGRGTTLGYWGGLARTIASFEAVLAYSPTAGRGKHARIPDLLRPDSGRSGPGPWLNVPWIDVLRLAGEHVNPEANKDSPEAKRWQRRRDAFEAAKYVAPDRGEATAGDTIEVQPVRGSRKHKAGLRIRASARMVEAARKSHDKREWTRLPAARLFPNDDD